MSQTAPPGWRWQHHAHLASTQDAAIAAAQAGDGGRLAITAALQSAGRGSRGRAWVAPAGNLNLSVLLRPPASRAEPGRWALLAGLALHDVLNPHAGPDLMLKWPNDVLLGGAKLGGILIDTTVGVDGYLAWVVLGFGVNLAQAPHIEGRAIACLPKPPPLAGEITTALLNRLDVYETMEMAPLRAAWLARAHPVGTLLDVVTRDARFTGAFAGLSPSGELLLAGRPGPISSAEIFPC